MHEKKLQFIKEVFGEYKLCGKRENAIVVCPFCKSRKGNDYSKKKLNIKIDNFLTHCWVCDYKSKGLKHIIKKFYPQYLSKYELLDLEFEISFEKNNIIEEKKIDLPHDFQLLSILNTNYKTNYVQKALDYLFSRGVTEEELWYYKFGISEEKDYRNRIIIPSFNEYGELNYFIARDFTEKSRLKYLNPNLDRKNIVFNEININWKEPLIIVEGIFDLIKCPSKNATCLLGSQLTPQYLLFKKIIKNKTPILLALDPDAFDKTIKIAKTLLAYKVIQLDILLLPRTIKDLGSLSKEEAKYYFQHNTINIQRIEDIIYYELVGYNENSTFSRYTLEGDCAPP